MPNEQWIAFFWHAVLGVGALGFLLGFMVSEGLYRLQDRMMKRLMRNSPP